MAVLSRIALGIVALVLGAACRTGQEQWGPFRGQVVDFESGDPIAGAYVMVMWIRDRPALHSGQSFYDARETRTGPDGRFEISYQRRWMTAFVTEPAISVFVPGYVMEGAAVVTGAGRPYVDATFISVRRLKTLEEKCKSRGIAPPIEAQRFAPQFVRSQQAYAAALDCR